MQAISTARPAGASPAEASHALPVQLTRFIGREAELATLGRLLAGTRLLTLTGAGGSGKTRLALELAAHLEQDGDGDAVAWVELAALADPTLVPQHLAAALGVRDDGGRPATDALLASLRHRTLLLVLDNCEHLADACAALADTLLRGCPALRILATSREALGVGGERAWLVPPLSLPAEGEDAGSQRLLEFEAVQLFVARAQDVAPAFVLNDRNAAAVAQICRRLDGLPLAIELAAARVRVLTPEQIARRLDNVFTLLTGGSRTALPRQRTLRATIDWSYALLSAPEQLLLQRLSVFAGGFTLEAVEAVCVYDRLAEDEVLDLLTRLVDRSLVSMTERDGAARYHLLDTVRLYAAERLNEHGEADAVRRRHAAFFLEFAESAAPHIRVGSSESDWFPRVEAEYGNLRDAMDWLLAECESDACLRLPIALRWYWYLRDTGDGRSRTSRALQRDHDHSPAGRAHARLALSAICFWQGDVPSMHTLLAEAIPTLRAVGDHAALAEALAWSGIARALSGEMEAGWAQVQEAVELARGVGGVLLSHVTGTAGYVALRRNDDARARELLEEALRLAHEVGFTENLEAAPITLGRLACRRAEYGRAADHFRQSLSLRRQRHVRYVLPLAIEGLGIVAAAQARTIRAARLLGAAERAREHMGTALNPFADEDRPAVEALRAAMGETAFEDAVAEGRAWAVARVVEYALADDDREAAAPSAAPSAAPAPGRASANAPATAPTSAPLDGGSPPSAAPATLRVLALGPLEIHVAGEPLPPAVWRYSRPKELLLLLLCHPEGRTREQIGLVFWPESSAAQVKNSFHVTLHHLRKVLGHNDWVVLENDRYRINAALDRELDADIFEQRMTQALRDARAGAGSADALRDALALYRGDFLQDETVGDWHLETRDHLASLYVQGLCALGELLIQAEEWAEAATLYRTVVVKEDLREDAHRNLMLCLARTGDRGRALRHYETLVALLREELDAEPEAETTALYEQLKQAAVR